MGLLIATVQLGSWSIETSEHKMRHVFTVDDYITTTLSQSSINAIICQCSNFANFTVYVEIRTWINSIIQGYKLLFKKYKYTCI